MNSTAASTVSPNAPANMNRELLVFLRHFEVGGVPRGDGLFERLDARGRVRGVLPGLVAAFFQLPTACREAASGFADNCSPSRRCWWRSDGIGVRREAPRRENDGEAGPSRIILENAWIS